MTVMFQGKMVTPWISKLRLVLFVLALALYVYVLVFLKTAYSRNKRLDAIDELVRHIDLHAYHLSAQPIHMPPLGISSQDCEGLNHNSQAAQ